MSLNFLINHNILAPQIDFLLYLQNLRLHMDSSVDNVFLLITKLGEYWLTLLIPAIIYWCVDTKKGVYLLSLCAFNLYFAHLIKMTACVYRPWILSDKIHPSVKAIPYAGGYSFPSGHSAMASSVWGGVAYIYKNHKFLCTILIIAVLLVGFSRMFLGVHTPQDVLIGIVIGVILIFILPLFINWLEDKKQRYIISLIIIDLILVLSFYYIFKKYYPIDYLNGKILVLPHKAISNTTIALGLYAGILNGLFLARRFFDFQIYKLLSHQNILKAIIGSIILYFLIKWCWIKPSHTSHLCLIMFIKTFLVGFYITLIYPLIWKVFTKK